jgi:probable rRNA maturation factor
MVVNIKNKSKIKKYYKNEIKKAVGYVLKKEIKKNKLLKKFLKTVPFNRIKLNILLTDDDEIKKYNKKYFNCFSSTDVISFSMIENDIMPKNDVLGDMIVSLQTIKKNSKIYNTSFKEELLLVIIHGLLHILGYDHLNENSVMRKKEKEYLKCISKIGE